MVVDRHNNVMSAQLFEEADPLLTMMQQQEVYKITYKDDELRCVTIRFP